MQLPQLVLLVAARGWRGQPQSPEKRAGGSWDTGPLHTSWESPIPTVTPWPSQHSLPHLSVAQSRPPLRHSPHDSASSGATGCPPRRAWAGGGQRPWHRLSEHSTPPRPHPTPRGGSRAQWRLRRTSLEEAASPRPHALLQGECCPPGEGLCWAPEEGLPWMLKEASGAARGGAGERQVAECSGFLLTSSKFPGN